MLKGTLDLSKINSSEDIRNEPDWYFGNFSQSGSAANSKPGSNAASPNRSKVNNSALNRDVSMTYLCDLLSKNINNADNTIPVIQENVPPKSEPKDSKKKITVTENYRSEIRLSDEQSELVPVNNLLRHRSF